MQISNCKNNLILEVTIASKVLSAVKKLHENTLHALQDPFNCRFFLWSKIIYEHLFRTVIPTMACHVISSI